MNIDKKFFTTLICLLTIVAIILASNAAIFKRAICVFAGRDRLVPIYRVQSDEKKIAISFDAAWGSDKTPKLLEILRKYNVKTTFFLVKMWMDKYPDMTKLIAKEGLEIGNHSATPRGWVVFQNSR